MTSIVHLTCFFKFATTMHIVEVPDIKYLSVIINLKLLHCFDILTIPISTTVHYHGRLSLELYVRTA